MKKLLSLLTLFSVLIMFAGCTTKEVTVLDTPCAKPTIDLAQFPEPKPVTFQVHKGTIVVTIHKADYEKMKGTNQDIKDRYVKLREWVLLNIKEGLVKASAE